VPDQDALPPHRILTAYYQTDGQRRSFLDGLFDQTAPHYDRVTGSIGLGSGNWHRRHALLRAGLRSGMRVLDVAIGTGAVARAAAGIVGAEGQVFGLDPSMGMLAETRRTLAAPVVQGRAEHLPFHDETFDFLSMGYALRHVSDLTVTFREYWRVLRPGGRLLILEFRRPRTWLGCQIARWHFGAVVPWLARLRGGGEHAHVLMRYCWDSVADSVPAGLICDAIIKAGFEQSRAKADFKVFIEYIAVKPERQARAAPSEPRPAASPCDAS
jgi:demethylmenaquinone methyltransferase/2-methoxy-6-polyprenyl-1,4-benzoquinol methylase